ncbi:MAG: hypothetical protein M3Y35_10880 [Actinomycetota bacterium]|nr:hypothetical protein [Actinomycetota bacterium]
MSTPETPEPSDAPPNSDDDTFEVIDAALIALATRRGRNLGDDHDVIGLLASLIDQAERFLPEQVASARENGTRWERIAYLLGTSPTEARSALRPRLTHGRRPMALQLLKKRKQPLFTQIT